MRVAGIARRLAYAAGGGACFIALTAFTLPLPLPTVSPTSVPLPLPSIPAILGSGSGSTQQPAGTQPAAAPPASTITHRSQAPAGVPASTAGPAAAQAAADGPLQTQVRAAAVQRADVPPASLTPSGGGPAAPSGPSAPQPVWLAAAFAAAFVLLMRRLDVIPAFGRRRLVRLAISPAVPEALDAAVCLCESMLPAGTAVKALGASGLAVRSGRREGAEVDRLIQVIARRAQRVGIEVTWPAQSSGAGPVSDRLVPA